MILNSKIKLAAAAAATGVVALILGTFWLLVNKPAILGVALLAGAAVVLLVVVWCKVYFWIRDDGW